VFGKMINFSPRIHHLMTASSAPLSILAELSKRSRERKAQFEKEWRVKKWVKGRDRVYWQ